MRPSAWFGAQVGSSVWLAVAGLRFLADDASLAGSLLVLFVLTNALGSSLWLLRERYPVRLLCMAMLTGHGIASLGALLTVAADGRLSTLRALEGGLNPWVTALAFPLVVFALALAWRRRA